ncbi:MAG TPA: hypothetical protein VGI81_20875 [Tepidisphaeraceae bacterium]|jgi:hypothetical protein
MLHSSGAQQIPKRQPKVKPAKAKPDVLKIHGIGWEDAVKKSFQKKKPASGWPK